MSNSDCVPAISDEHFMIDACPNRKDLSNYVIGATDDETAANIDSHRLKQCFRTLKTSAAPAAKSSCPYLT
jgi:hypothetical protein